MWFYGLATVVEAMAQSSLGWEMGSGLEIVYRAVIKNLNHRITEWFSWRGLLRAIWSHLLQCIGTLTAPLGAQTPSSDHGCLQGWGSTYGQPVPTDPAAEPVSFLLTAPFRHWKAVLSSPWHLLCSRLHSPHSPRHRSAVLVQTAVCG